MTSKIILTASVAAIALAVGSFAVAGDAFARGGGGGGHGGSSRSAMSSMSYGKSSSMKMSSSSHKHHRHHHRKRSYIGGYDGCDGYYKNGVCIEDDDED
jgi:hypothetical protein